MAAYFTAPAVEYDPPPLPHTLLTQPIKTFIRLLDVGFSLLRTIPKPAKPNVQIVCIADTHTHKTELPDGDLLVHAGDLANEGTPAEIQAQIDWIAGQPYEHKVVIAGNHDTWLDARSRTTLAVNDQRGRLNWKGIKYLQHSSTILKFRNGRELKVYGAPQIPHDGGHKEFAFQYPPGSDAWSGTIPPDTDVLVTHTPPKYHMDLPIALGCEHLLAEVWKVRPALHVFGHIHAGKTDFVGRLKGGREVVRWDVAQKRLEYGLTRPDGFFVGLLNPRSWMDVIRTLFYGIAGVLWDRIWGGVSPRATTMILASLVYDSTGQIGHPAQVVVI